MLGRINKEKQKRKNPVWKLPFSVAGGGPDPSTSGL